MSDSTVRDSPSNDEILAQLDTLLAPEETLLTHMANMAALLYCSLKDVNWVGFYLTDGARLHLGPFQGKPACTVIDMGKGVCGTSAAERRTIVVPDVHSFPGHITCDPSSRSEVVVPLQAEGTLWGVLDVDSPVPDRFCQSDTELLERSAAVLVRRARRAKGALFPLDTLF
ncbi:MAG: GAF domain-containing protein [Bacteroidetes bacterium]|nr:GAF domain-containing protein [Bacteroidota bacterium]